MAVNVIQLVAIVRTCGIGLVIDTVGAAKPQCQVTVGACILGVTNLVIVSSPDSITASQVLAPSLSGGVTDERHDRQSPLY